MSPAQVDELSMQDFEDLTAQLDYYEAELRRASDQ